MDTKRFPQFSSRFEALACAASARDWLRILRKWQTGGQGVPACAILAHRSNALLRLRAARSLPGPRLPG